MRRFGVFLAALLALSVVVSACGGQKQQEPAGGGDTTQPPAQPKANYLRVPLGDEPPSLDPQITTDTISFEILAATYEGLVRRGPDGTIQKGSGMAEDWTVSEDGTVWTFKLRQNNKWSDGQPVTAKDFEYAWKRAVDPRVASDYAFIVADYIKGGNDVLNACGDDKSCEGDEQKIDEAKAAMGVKALDDYTLEVTLNKPTPWFLSLLTFGTYRPVRQDIVEKFAEKFAIDEDSAVYSGPFVIADWQHEQSLRLEKNPNYWDAANVKLEYIEMPIIKDSQTLVNLFEAGQLDVAGVPSNFVELFQQKYADMLVPWFDGGTFYLQFNVNRKPLNNAKARKAILLAIDRKAYIDTIRKGVSLAATGFTNPVITAPDQSGSFYEKYVAPLNLWPAEGNKEEAKRLWQEALQEEGMSGPVKMELLCYDGDTALLDCQFFQAQVAELGLELTIRQLPFQEKLATADRGEFDIDYAGWGPDYDHMLTFLDLWVTGAPFNRGGYSNSRYDELVKQLQSELDPKKQIEIAVEIEKLIAEDPPIAPIYHRQRLSAQRPYVKGIVRSAFSPDNEFKWATAEERP